MIDRRELAHLVLPLLAAVMLSGCGSKAKFEVGDFVMPTDKTDPQSVLKIVGRDDQHYNTFDHFLSDGRLVQAEVYKVHDRKEFERTHVKVERPNVEGSFSPDKWLSKQEPSLKDLTRQTNAVGSEFAAPGASPRKK